MLTAFGVLLLFFKKINEFFPNSFDLSVIYLTHETENQVTTDIYYNGNCPSDSYYCYILCDGKHDS